MTRSRQTNHGDMNLREDAGMNSTERSHDTTDLSNAPRVEKEQENTQDQNTNAGQDPVVVAEKRADVPPNGGYGWICVAACATINA